ncbi:UNVERIFIED_CONTAM: putative spermidine/putrescine transport system permease protein [Brevibacillus sp. OAP136]
MWLRAAVACIVLALIAPILVIIPLSFTSVSYFQFPPPGFSFKWYQSIMENPSWVDGMVNSLTIGALTAILSTLLGTMAAIAVSRLQFPGKKLFMSVILAPMVVPVIIVAISLYQFLAPLHWTNSISGVVLSHAILAIPIVFVTVSASLKGVDRNLELAASGLGSTPVGVFFRITMPLIRPGILSGALFAFITSFDEVVVTIFISGASSKTLPVVMWENLRTQVDPSLAAISTILIFGTVILFVFQEWVGSRAKQSKAT